MSQVAFVLFFVAALAVVNVVVADVKILRNPLVASSLPADKLAEPIIPYPAPIGKPKLVYGINTESWSDQDTLLILSLKGQLSKKGLNDTSIPLIFTYAIGNSNVEFVYWNNYVNTYNGTVFDNKTFAGAQCSDVVKKLASYVTGYILVTMYVESMNVGVSLAAITPNTIVAGPSQQSWLKEAGIPLFQDVTKYTEAQFLQLYLPNNWVFSTRFLSNQFYNKSYVSLSDWTILMGAMQVYSNNSYNSIITYLTQYKHIKVNFGWIPDGSDEHSYVGFASSNNAMVLASDWSNNLATHVHLRPDAPIVNPTRQENFPLANNKGKHTVTFIWTDGDNICSDMNLITDTQHFASPHPNRAPMGWGINPSLYHVAPIGLQSYYSLANASVDSFIGFSAGYAFPNDMDQNTIVQWAEATGEAMYKADISVMNYIADTFVPGNFDALHSQWNIEGTFFFTYYGNYVLPYPQNGTVIWLHDKPAVSMRQALWAGHQTPASIAALLNALSKDETSNDGYSAIAIHIWSETVDSVMDCISQLDDSVVVVKPDEFVQLMKNNVKRDVIA